VTPPGDRFERVLRGPIEAMHRFASACTHGDGEVPLFNDSVLGQAPGRVDVLRYAERVCGIGPRAAPDGFVAFPEFGLFRLGDRRSGAWLDAGETGPPFLQAHAHADTGSLELSVGEHRIVCDSGVYSYQDPARRAWDRSTPAHSTLSVGGESSSDCWGSFRVARRARVRSLDWSAGVGNGAQSVTFSHDGFRHLPGSPRHERRVTFHDGAYTIQDQVVSRLGGRGPLRCDGFLYLGPGVTVLPRGRDAVEGGPPGGWVFDLGHAERPGLLIRVRVSFPVPPTAAEVFLEPATLAPSFHTDRPGHRLRAAWLTESGTAAVAWTLSLTLGPEPDRAPS
jgi:hypothetical protein